MSGSAELRRTPSAERLPPVLLASTVKRRCTDDLSSRRAVAVIENTATSQLKWMAQEKLTNLIILKLLASANL